MNVNLFERPEKHPFEMLAGCNLPHTMEAEQVLAWILDQCVKAGEFKPIQTRHKHPVLVEAGLLKEVGSRIYSLTKKAKGLLYGYYGKDD